MNLLYIFFPIFGLYEAVKNFLKSHSAIPIVIFGFWFGFSVFYYSGDILAYRDDFGLLVKYSWNDFVTIVLNTYSRDGKPIFNSNNLFHQKPDLFAFVLGFLISRFSENPRLFFGFLGAIYFFLMHRFLKESVEYTGSSLNKNWRLFLIFLSLIVPFYVGVTGVRFWTALFLFGWMILKYINSGRLKFLFFAAISCLFHYTFIFPVLILLLAFFLRVNKIFMRPLILVGVFYAVLASTTSSLDFISDILNFFDNEIIEDSAGSYLDKDALSARQVSADATNWYVKWRVHILNLFFLLFYLVDFFSIRKKKPIKSFFFERLYDFFFLISVFTLNLGSISRFIYIFYLIILIRLMEIHMKSNYRNYSIWSKIVLPVLILHVFVTFRAGFYYVDPNLLIAPSIFLILVEAKISLSQLLVGH